MVIFLFLGIGIYYTQFSTSEIVTNISLKPNDTPTINLGASVYAKNCASCHGANLEGQTIGVKETKWILARTSS